MGIIGGADGPTVIFVSAAPDGWILLGLIALAALLLVGILWVKRRRKRK